MSPDPRFSVDASGHIPGVAGLISTGQFEDARQHCLALLEGPSPPAVAHYYLGLIARAAADPAGALQQFEAAVQRQPGVAAFHLQAGTSAAAAGKPETALRHFNTVLALAPDQIEARLALASLQLTLDRPAEALPHLERAIALQPTHPRALVTLGLTLRRLGRRAEAIRAYRQALTQQPDATDALINLGNLLAESPDPAEALTLFDRAIGLRPDVASAHFGRGNALLALRAPAEALAAYDRAKALDPTNAAISANRGIALQRLNQTVEAIAELQSACTLAPDRADFRLNLAGALLEAGDVPAAIEHGRQALAIGSETAAAHYHLGEAHRVGKDYVAAVTHFARAVELAPGSIPYRGALATARMYLCDWTGEPETRQEIERQILAGEKILQPFAALALLDAPEVHHRLAALHAREWHTTPATPARPASAPRQDARIRLGYISADFYNHATSYLIADMLERHDRRRFEVVALSFGPQRVDTMSRRIAAAALSRSLPLDIAIDLNGYTTASRPGIFAARAAPLQIGFLGYPGTTGGPANDYIIADSLLIPPEDRRHYSEKVITLPGCYQPNAARRDIAMTPSRSAAGLPETGFVFAAFNNSHKIRPEQFDRWMSILQAVDGSVLWLLRDTDASEQHLRRAAAARRIEVGRLIFAPRLPLPEHLARHRLADLFLDTAPYNGHTTASDALFMGLPVLTCPGRSFAARVGASLLTDLGLPDLIAPDPATYQAMAIVLARSPAKLDRLRARLAAARETSGLFDPARYVRLLERALEAAHQRHLAGLPPDHLTIERDEDDAPDVSPRR